MPKIVAAKTMQLSVRIDDEDRKRMDQIRDHQHKLSKSLDHRPAMSDVARTAMAYGIRMLCKDCGIKYVETPAPTKKAAKKDEKKAAKLKKAKPAAPKPKKPATSRPKKQAAPKPKKTAAPKPKKATPKKPKAAAPPAPTAPASAPAPQEAAPVAAA